MKLTYTSVFSYLRIAVAGTLVLAAAALAVTATKTSSPPSAPGAHAFAFKKGDPDMIRAGDNKRARIGANEYRGALYTPAIEDFLKRAYPSDDIPGDASVAAFNGFTTLNSAPHTSGVWKLRGPSKANVPDILNSLGDNALYVTAGRVSAMAIGPTCVNGNCPIYVAAAGGGIWRTKDGLKDDAQWQFVSSSFGTNAIGSILIDPSNANTIYVGTGEPNASGDSEAGVGIYKSTDGGTTWTLVPGSDIFFQRSVGGLALDNSGNLLACVASGVRGISSVTSGASSSGATGHPLVTRGLYRQTGATFTRIFTAPGATRGSTTVKVDPTHPGIIYVNAFGGNAGGPGTSGGVWRSVDNGASFQQIFAPRDATANTTGAALERDEFDITTLPSGATRLYVGAGEGGAAFNPPSPSATFWRSDNADTAATFASFGGAQVLNYCTGQCWYDNFVYSPKGYPDVVYLLGSFDYNQKFAGLSNARGVLLSTDGGSTWSDLTQDGKPSRANFTHPDQHAIVTNPNNPYQYWEGSDGGVVRSDGKFANVASKCDARGLSPSGNAYCKSLLFRVPNQLSNNINPGLSTLQFQSISVSGKNPLTNLQAGTQDNGTWQFAGSTIDASEEIYGDGGQSGYSSTDDNLRFNTFTGQANDANFRNGDPTKWVIISAPILTSAEGAYFYPPIISDPNPANAQTIYQGSFSVWRTQDWGGNREYLEAHCPEFTTSAAQAGCGDFVPLGGPADGSGTDAGDLIGTFYGGGDRFGGAVAWLTRAPQNTFTMWAATGAGRVFISDNINANPAVSVLWNRIDPNPAHLNTPSRAISQIYVDPSNNHHAWIGYNGYNVNTPSQPGHVFEVTWSGTGAATWVDISYNLPDFPITALVRDDVTGDLYAGSDFGVMKLPNAATAWAVAGSGLPMVAVPGLTIVPSARILYAATHGRSAWSLALP
jgi:hypothetical protein